MNKTLKQNRKIAVLAGNYREFQFFTKDEDKYIYVDFPEKIMGRELERVITIGTWYKKENAHKLLDLASANVR